MTNDEEEWKRIVKQAIKEWLDEQFAAFGRWTLYGLLSVLLAGIVAFLIHIEKIR